MMTQEIVRMEAEIVVDRDKVDPLVAKFAELGFEVEVIDWPDHWQPDDPPNSTVVATVLTELVGRPFWDYVVDILMSCGLHPLGERHNCILMHTDQVEGPSLLRAPGVVRRRPGRA